MNGHALRDATFDRIRIANPGVGGAGHGIVEARGAAGSATISNVLVTNPKSGGWQDDAPAFKLVRGTGNSGVEDGKQASAEDGAARRNGN